MGDYQRIVDGIRLFLQSGDRTMSPAVQKLATEYAQASQEVNERLRKCQEFLRQNLRSEATHLEVGSVRLDLRRRRAEVDGVEVELSAREFLLAETLMRHPGQVLSREQLLSRVWGYDFAPGSNVVDVYIGYLRRKLGREVVETVRGAGYRMVEAPESASAGP